MTRLPLLYEPPDSEWGVGDGSPYQTKRLLFGNPKATPRPRVSFLQLNRYKHYRHPGLSKSGWDIIGPPSRPSWIEREGLLSNQDRLREQESRARSIGVVWCHWWNPNQWCMSLPRWSLLFAFRVERQWDRFFGEIVFFGVTLWGYRYAHVSKADLRKRLIESKKAAGEWGG
jgi:hypothetical protein